jgi:hypothetical protein
MPIAFSDEEKDLLLELARPINQSQRSEFLAAVAAELEAEAGRTGVVHGPGVAHRVGRVIQRRFSEPPQFREGQPAAAPKARYG